MTDTALDRECWTWIGALSQGYPVLAGRRIHREIVEATTGVILTHDMIVHHTENCLRGISPSARLARRTHCKYGHPFSGDNLTSYKWKKRVCRACERARGKRRYRLRAELEAAGKEGE